MRTLAVLLLVVCACKGEPPPVERLQATPDKSQPAVAVVPLAQLQQVRPERVVLVPVDEEPTPGASRMTAEEFGRRREMAARAEDEAADPPSMAPLTLGKRVHAALTLLEEGQILSADVKGDDAVVELTGRAKDHGSVAELMLAVGSLVQLPGGLGRIIERKREARTVRVHMLSSTGPIQEVSNSEVQTLSVELHTAQLQKNGELTFQLTVRENLAGQ